jgi:hypothetical protein
MKVPVFFQRIKAIFLQTISRNFIYISEAVQEGGGQVPVRSSLGQQ